MTPQQPDPGPDHLDGLVWRSILQDMEEAYFDLPPRSKTSSQFGSALRPSPPRTHRQRRQANRKQYVAQNPSYAIVKDKDYGVWLSNAFWLGLPIVVFMVCLVFGITQFEIPQAINDHLPQIYLGKRHYPYRINTAWFCLGIWLPLVGVLCFLRYFIHQGDRAAIVNRRHYWKKG